MWYDSKKQNILEEWNSAKVKRKTCSRCTDCQILYKNALFKETSLLELNFEGAYSEITIIYCSQKRKYGVSSLSC